MEQSELFAQASGIEQSGPFPTTWKQSDVFVQTWHFPTYCSPTSAAMSCDELFSPLRTPKRRGHRRRLSHRKRNMLYQVPQFQIMSCLICFRQSNFEVSGYVLDLLVIHSLMLLNKAMFHEVPISVCYINS